MSSLNNNDYYRRLLIQHYQKPKNYSLLKQPNSYYFHHYSSSCADNFCIELSARFEGSGCVIATAAIDLFCQLITNKTLQVVKTINNNYQAMLASKTYDQQLLAFLQVFENVLKQPHRLVCALIICEAISAILLQIAK